MEYLNRLSVFVYLGPWQSQIVYVNNVTHGVNLGPCGISVISGRVWDWVMKVNHVGAKCPYDQSPRKPWTPKSRWVSLVSNSLCVLLLIIARIMHYPYDFTGRGQLEVLCLVSPGLSPLLILLCILLPNLTLTVTQHLYCILWALLANHRTWRWSWWPQQQKGGPVNLSGYSLRSLLGWGIETLTRVGGVTCGLQ